VCVSLFEADRKSISIADDINHILGVISERKRASCPARFGRREGFAGFGWRFIFPGSIYSHHLLFAPLMTTVVPPPRTVKVALGDATNTSAPSTPSLPSKPEKVGLSFINPSTPTSVGDENKDGAVVSVHPPLPPLPAPCPCATLFVRLLVPSPDTTKIIGSKRCASLVV
jgi:hypothetical protein